MQRLARPLPFKPIRLVVALRLWPKSAHSELMTTSPAEFEQLENAIAGGGIQAGLDRLADQLLAKKAYRELFEARKMQVRHSLGLPPLYSEEGDELSDDVRDKLEDGLIEACREVGMLLLESGNIREGWMYMRPVGEKEAVAKVLRQTEIDDENVDELVEVALSEGVDTEFGYKLVLDHYGTCNSITTFETELSRRSRRDQQAAAALLLRHVHEELCQSLRADIAQQEGNEPGEVLIVEMLGDREWLFQENAYHIDTTHLASTVKYARVLDDKDSLRLALDLTEYGRRLGSQFQYQGDEPFADIHASHGLYFQSLLGEHVDQAVEFFKNKAETVEINEHGTAAIEIYVDLLARLGRSKDAMNELLRLMPAEVQSVGLAPSLFELAQQANNFDQLLDYCRERDDLLGFATSLVHSKLAAPPAT